jgi:hypothetical protein
MIAVQSLGLTVADRLYVPYASRMRLRVRSHPVLFAEGPAFRGNLTGQCLRCRGADWGRSLVHYDHRGDNECQTDADDEENRLFGMRRQDCSGADNHRSALHCCRRERDRSLSHRRLYGQKPRPMMVKVCAQVCRIASPTSKRTTDIERTSTEAAYSLLERKVPHQVPHDLRGLQLKERGHQ